MTTHCASFDQEITVVWIGQGSSWRWGEIVEIYVEFFSHLPVGPDDEVTDEAQLEETRLRTRAEAAWI